MHKLPGEHGGEPVGRAAPPPVILPLCRRSIESEVQIMEAEAVQELIREDRTAWAALVVVLEAHPDGALHDPESPEWTSRDVYTHLASMMEGTTKTLQDRLAGKPKPDYSHIDEDRWNAHLQKKHAHMSLEEARSWASRALDERCAAFEAVPLERWDDELREIASHDGADHFRGHSSYIATS